MGLFAKLFKWQPKQRSYTTEIPRPNMGGYLFRLDGIPTCPICEKYLITSHNHAEWQSSPDCLACFTGPVALCTRCDLMVHRFCSYSLVPDIEFCWRVCEDCEEED